ncbi:SGNH/GDSL hydrolase family protein [Nafulsella turpanensis]|uniref:SGNH/GDSL hydrolase family protein n=1 Tax=Nafulsella turpanensis TaxID=1265690 RepID=UPI0003466CC1|nr:SGNH/GDSL hydrolase family protein [Nafulsella turpanensis]
MNTFLALGDSYTIGEAVSEEGRWPVQLVNRLRQEEIAIAEPEIIATTGWTTDELQTAIDEEKPAADYDLVSLLIGVNNQYRGYSFDAFRKEFEQLLQQAIQFSGNRPAHVLVVAIPDYSVTPFAAEKDKQEIAEELKQYNQYKQQLAEKYGVPFFNIFPDSQLAAQDVTLIAEDGLHPSASMYSLWVNRIAPYVVNLLK